MRRIILAALLLTNSFSLFSQYQKASFFSRSGRTYSLGVNLHALGGGRGTPLGYYFAQGADNNDKHLFFWYDIEVIPSYKFSYQTSYTDIVTNQEVPVNVTGSSRLHLIYNYHLGYHFLNRSETAPRLQPYAFAGVSLIAFGKSKDDSNAYTYGNLKKYPVEGGFTLGVKGGLGVLWAITPKLGLNITTSYHPVFNFGGNIDVARYDVFVSHVAASAAIRFKVIED